MIKLRDRDAIITDDGFIFRVYGYIHPEDAYICDPEYAIPGVFKSSNPRACRGEKKLCYFKFFSDEGIRLILNKYPNYSIFYWPLQKCVVGVIKKDVTEVRIPNVELRNLLEKDPGDVLVNAFNYLFKLVLSKSGLSIDSFGVFGSLLHQFYHPKFSDIDFTVYGRDNLKRLCEVLGELYREDNCLRNEFDKNNSLETKDWKFVNYSLKEYLWHQRRKLIYGIFYSKDMGRNVKIEFEPVKELKEIHNEYSPFSRIFHLGWIKAIVEITDDKDSPFIPSIYQINVKDILKGPKIDNITRVFSYMEEFRMQAKEGEYVLVEGNLEKVVNGSNIFYQITLSYGPRYYEQMLKVVNKKSLISEIEE
jgi:predicted nucleotidyltransferase